MGTTNEFRSHERQEIWMKREQDSYAASRQRLSDEVIHLGMANGFKKYQGHRVHRNNYRNVPGNVGSLPPREKPAAPEMTVHQHIPHTGPSAWKDKGCKTPEQFRNGKTMGTRQKPKTQIIGIIR